MNADFEMKNVSKGRRLSEDGSATFAIVELLIVRFNFLFTLHHLIQDSAFTTDVRSRKTHVHHFRKVHSVQQGNTLRTGHPYLKNVNTFLQRTPTFTEIRKMFQNIGFMKPSSLGKKGNVFTNVFGDGMFSVEDSVQWC